MYISDYANTINYIINIRTGYLYMYGFYNICVCVCTGWSVVFLS